MLGLENTPTKKQQYGDVHSHGGTPGLMYPGFNEWFISWNITNKWMIWGDPHDFGDLHVGGFKT